MFKFDNINKVFKGDFWSKPFTALENVSFEVTPGNVVGFLGANGAGKTTAIKILMGYIHATSGEVSFGSSLGSTRREILKKVGYLPERPYFYPDLSAREFLNYVGKLNELPQSEINSEVEKWTNLLKINFALDRKLRFFSKGMLQRLGFTATLINNPELLILDEPLAGLDPIGRKEFKDVMIELANLGKTIFFSSHIIHDVEEVSKDVVILDKGKLIYSGNVNNLVDENSTNDYELHLSSDASLNSEIFRAHASTSDRKVFLIDKSKINEALGVLSSNNVEIFKLIHRTPTLEDIVYKVNK